MDRRFGTPQASEVVVPFRLAGVREDVIRIDAGRYVEPSDFRMAALDSCNGN
jgi:hypothetical protein